MEGKFWFSQKQKETSINNLRNFCQLEDGTITEYTEMVQGCQSNKNSNFEDATYLGTGVYHSSECEYVSHHPIMGCHWVGGINLIRY